MNREIKEILEYLEGRKDYVIWAGFCVFAHLGIKPSLDVDIYVNSSETKSEIFTNFQKRGWRRIPHVEMDFEWDKLEKEGTTLDIVYSSEAARLLFSDAVEIEVYGNKVRFLSKEWLFLTKLGQLSWKDRKEEKRKRDIETIDRLRSLIDLKKLNQLASKLPVSYWRTGQV
jgi:hypothetical protein